jgi:hypothetical protein
MVSYYAPSRMLHATVPSRLANREFGCVAQFAASTGMLSRFELEHHFRSDIVHENSLSLWARKLPRSRFRFALLAVIADLHRSLHSLTFSPETGFGREETADRPATIASMTRQSEVFSCTTGNAVVAIHSDRFKSVSHLLPESALCSPNGK